MVDPQVTCTSMSMFAPTNILSARATTLYCQIPISFTQAALGATIEVLTIDDVRVKVAVPAGTQSGKMLRLKGRVFLC